MPDASVTFPDGSGSSNAETPNGSKRGALRRESSVALRLNLRRELQGLQRRLTDAANTESEVQRQQLQRPAGPASCDSQRRADAAIAGELVSSLQETVYKNEETMSQLRRQLAEVESQKKSTEKELKDMKKTHAKMKKINYDLIKDMAAKASKQLRSRDESKQTAVDEVQAKYLAMESLYDDLVEKVEQIADENGELVARIRKLEEEGRRNREGLAAMEGTQEECDVLRQSLEEAVEMARGMGEALERIASDRESTAENYELRLEELNAKLAQATLEQTRTYEENELLRTQFADADRHYKENLARAMRGEKEDSTGKRITAYLKKWRGGHGKNEGGQS